ncbi:GHMP kinase [Flavobacterium sp. LC2016-01]|uniref:GHMP family kinase ATP-binding protein n=1 Tax=Flavobacterium sp. LC2016-01 TaxID=2675876 RepID=UPI0012BAD84F|nr:GHMP kinase [Flavobacterium sp. LC2016-01]MTH17515.1 GHMP kinase [Flavobacterium sp. LC2016-01]
MIISRTPFRISFAGGGSDLKEYYQNHGGAVLSVSIDKYVYLSMHPYFNDDKYLLKYSNIELVDRLDQIQHRIIRKVFEDFDIKGVDFNSSADIPSGTGLGSSSAFTSGLISLCNAYQGKYLSREMIAELACIIEIDKLHEPIGKQDQYACALGGLNFIEFRENEKVIVERVKMNQNKYDLLENYLLMFYLGNTRKASSILTEQKENTKSDHKKVDNLHKMVGLAHDLKKELLSNNIESMGEILHTGWMYKKELASNISNKDIDIFYEKAIRAGAVGGKLLGAGGGGFLLFYVEESKQQAVRSALSDLYELQFKFDNTGTSIIF